VLRAIVFRDSMHDFSETAQAKITTNFCDNVHILHTFHLKFTIINDSIVYILVETKFSMYTVCRSPWLVF